MACCFVVTIGQARALGSVVVVRQGLAGHQAGRRGRSARLPRACMVLRSVKALIDMWKCGSPRSFGGLGGSHGPSCQGLDRLPRSRKEGASTWFSVPASVGGHATPRREASDMSRWFVDGVLVLPRHVVLSRGRE
jgi:hypothetical protein